MSDGLSTRTWGQIRGVQAVLFDMDGTLVDSEDAADGVIGEVLEAHGVLAEREAVAGRYHGMTWRRVEAQLAADYPALAGVALAAELQVAFQRLFVGAPLIPSAAAAIEAALAHHPTGIVTSGNRESLESLTDRLALAGRLAVSVCAEDGHPSKPDPACYLAAAEHLGVAPARCLVFEDSHAGLAAAGAAGAQTIAVLCRAASAVRQEVGELADAWIEDYSELPAGFFGAISEEAR